MSHSLNSSKGDYIYGITIRGTTGDTRSLDYSSYCGESHRKENGTLNEHVDVLVSFEIVQMLWSQLPWMVIV